MYQSTRGEVRDVGFEDALISGFCGDGGLFMPRTVPKIPLETLKKWSKLSFVELAKKITPFFIQENEITKDCLFDLLDAAFLHFPNRNIIELVELTNDLKILELFHGPTMAFKDISMVCIGQLLDFCLKRRKKHSTVLVATSGDTGSSAIEAVRGLEHIDIIVLLPLGRISETQELFMTTVLDKNVHVFRGDGTSDDLDVPIRRCFSDADFVAQHNLASINSANWTRIMIQIVIFFYAYFRSCPSCDEEVEVVVPTGGCGNITAGSLARKMGLPIKLVGTVNSNDYLVRLIETGIYTVDGTVIQSVAPAMDIQNAYNVERLLWLFSDGDSALVKTLMNQLERTHRIEIPARVLSKMKESISAHRADDAGILSAMHRCGTENKYTVCPHTATAVHYHYSHFNSDSASLERTVRPTRVCLATASPAKFREAVLAAGLTQNLPSEIEALKSKPTKYEHMRAGEDWHAILRNCITKIAQERS